MATDNTYIVQKGDNLTKIAAKFNTTVRELVRLNNIKNPDVILIGQVLKITGDPTIAVPNRTTKPTITHFGLQANADRTLYAAWSWDKTNTKGYKVSWRYDTGNGVWFVGESGEVTDKQSTYNAPDNAIKVEFKVLPVSDTRTVNGKETTYWTAFWSTAKTHAFANVPDVSAPSVEINLLFLLTATIENVEEGISIVQFEVVKNDESVVKTGKVAVLMSNATFTCTISPGGRYKVRCRGIKNDKPGEWSPYSANVSTAPSNPSKPTKCEAASETSIRLEWVKVDNADSYDIEYTTDESYFNGSNEVETVSNITTTTYEKTGLTSGQKYFFRIRATNTKGTSGWSEVVSTIIGSPPAAPTTWSSTTTAIVGEPLNLYWVHNSEDGSSQTYAELELTVDGKTETKTIKNSTNEEEKDKTSVYSIDTSSYREGVKILWRVRTKGITARYSDWSIQRTVDIYAQPDVGISITDTDKNPIDIITSFPFYFSAIPGPPTQVPTGYHVTITADHAHETIDDLGRVRYVIAGEAVYSNYFDTYDQLIVRFSANNLNLENNQSYTITCVVSMDSGLTAESSKPFTVAWQDELYEPMAEIGIDEDIYSAWIRPYCEDENGDRLEGMTLAVYRRNFDGTFTEIASGLDNSKNIFVVDPHPALDYARYRIVSKMKDTGAVSYSDISGYPVGCNSVILQWDDNWNKFEVSGTDAEALMDESVWAGAMIKIPYNIDISEKTDIDVTHVKYIGRSHPVSYHGTQLGVTQTWNVEIPKYDTETLYALRRLAIWTGNVYVREPSGNGYWATVGVSFNQKHRELTIPITFNITRVEGGI